MDVCDAWKRESPKQKSRVEGLAKDSGKLVSAEKLKVVWSEMLKSEVVPDAESVSRIINSYGSIGDFDMISKILRLIQLKDAEILHDIFRLTISCFGKRGQLECMDCIIKEMVSLGYSVDSATGNAYVLYYSSFGTLAEVEVAYGRLKRSRILLEGEGIRAISFAYIKENKFYALGKFLRNVGLCRRDVGNLIWNLLLLSYAADFKMKSLQREFVRMVEAGFRPDLNTFNVRALAFSKMSLLWDLHLSLEHMTHESVAPDLVTYGCVVDAYMDRRLARNLKFAFSKLNWNSAVSVLTDPLIFEAMGKGDFHSSSEVVLGNSTNEDWTYKRLIDIYLKKRFRSNQIFWNY
ncbi:pentatricopeptide repeat-containing protein [Dorcoceras hygrometricum]|uniref:Pentatricopeptide repeat-containing protein n=1 Tax=Dorcoceras hygrometricum TaxID=472368 RepID=A0A2Z7B519_9LAMI|nr:pentatricopeptide repeat-containing protein [Dorcoceras hygrometricum]